MSRIEEQLRFAHQNLSTAMTFGKNIDKAKAEVVRLTALFNKPKIQRKTPAKNKEGSIQWEILKMLRKHPKVGLVWRQNSMTAKFSNRDGTTRFVKANSAKGMSDIMGTLKDGRALAIEVKKPGESVEPHQQAFLDKINASGGVAFVARSVDDANDKLREA